MTQPVLTKDDLDRIAEDGSKTLYRDELKIMIGSASCGIAAGAREVEAAALEAVEELQLDATVTRTGCIGYCQHEPLVDVFLVDGPRVTYGDMTPKKIRRLLQAYAAERDLRPEMALCRFDREEYAATGESCKYPPSSNGLAEVPEWSEVDFFRRQQRIILRNCGSINPLAIEEAITRGAYRGALRALTQMTPEDVIDTVSESGLRGRGGAGFPTGRKWDTARRQPSDQKYVICNADEGDPGAFMDRSVLEGDPHAVIEGMIIAAYAVGASEAYVYVRSEYPLAVSTIEYAIEQARQHGLLGDNIFGSGFSLRIQVRRGAGAFVCGEETSLIASIEGHAGEPRPRPPFPAVRGLWGNPTVINNVKTLSSIGPILARGADWYAASGTERNRGTTVFALVGAVKNTGLVEVPLGISLREMVFDIGGGMRGNRPLKAIQTGGPSGGCIPESMLDLPIDYEKLSEAGSMMGSGGMIVLDSGTCMVDLARFFLAFTADESCGKCVPCREGTKQMLRILGRICDGDGTMDDIEQLEQLAGTVRSASLCGLGSTAPNPVLSTMRHFRDEFEAHVKDKKCPAGVCKKLITIQIDQAACTGCGQCVKVCPVDAISGEPKLPHRVDADRCTRCGACRNTCSFEAVMT